MRKFKNTSTILDNYPSYAAMIRDLSITENQLIELVNNAIYYKGICRVITRHPNCTQKVYEAMRCSPVWFIRIAGYFCYRQEESIIRNNIKRVLIDNTEDKRIINKATDLVVNSLVLYQATWPMVNPHMQIITRNKLEYRLTDDLIIICGLLEISYEL